MSKALLIDPERCTVTEIVLPDGAKAALAAMRDLIGCKGMDNRVIDDMHDSIWVDDLGLTSGRRVYAFKLSINPDPFAGRAIIVGADELGREADVYITREFVARDIVWLGEIVPEVTWVPEANGMRAVVTYARPKA